MRSIDTSRGFGAAIRRARNDQGLSQAELAASAGVGRPWLSELERGKQTAELGRALLVLSALGLSLTFAPTAAPRSDMVNLNALIDDLY